MYSCQLLLFLVANNGEEISSAMPEFSEKIFYLLERVKNSLLDIPQTHNDFYVKSESFLTEGPCPPCDFPPMEMMRKPKPSPQMSTFISAQLLKTAGFETYND